MKFRHEIKHYINYGDYLLLRNRLKFLLRCDHHANELGEYKIRSIYFDNYHDKALQEKLMGINNREKFRIRYYNDDVSFIRLEKKSKVNGLCAKVSAPLSDEQAQSIMDGEFEFLKNSTHALHQELYYKMKNELLRPKTIVDYTREAYIHDVGNVRITFDKRIRTGITSIDALNPLLPTVEGLDSNLIILEVKFDEFLPEFISDVLQNNYSRSTSVSKYAVCRIYG
ncbi:polyphosphate polymerase domain-containing protein [Turicibacter sanguinis]|uniref:polyphosphate polymerase domain-containing protein n=1 Tax=Turicibacter sanguinis TaxID=154288 RepID=UPI001E436A20|nr:polyphosphate polymerase domain-containing protein [Turicibacter sanguinis]MDB8551385.1 polyphosphate polymerase domain-containing protein [Turicibacter sanguinis]